MAGAAESAIMSAGFERLNGPDMSVSGLSSALSLVVTAQARKDISVAMLKQKHALDQAMVQAIAQATQQANANAQAAASGRINIVV